MFPFCVYSCGHLLGKVETTLGLNSWRKVTLSTPTAINCQSSSSRGWCFDPFPSMLEFLIFLVLWRPCMDSHNCCQFICDTASSCPQDSISQQFLFNFQFLHSFHYYTSSILINKLLSSSYLSHVLNPLSPSILSCSFISHMFYYHPLLALTWISGSLFLK